MKGLAFQVKETEDKVKSMDTCMEEQKRKIQESERHSRRWNLRLINLPEKENVREVLKTMSQIAPDDKNKVRFVVDTVHRVGRPRDNKSSIQHHVQLLYSSICVCIFWNKMRKDLRNAAIMRVKNKERKVPKCSLNNWRWLKRTADDQMDRLPSREGPNSRFKAISYLCEQLNIIGVWRYIHPDQKEYTWSNVNSSIQSWIDLWLLSSLTLRLVSETLHSYAPSLVNPEEQTKKIHGYW